MNTDTPRQSLAKELFMGFCLGIANIIPGVSGGTFLLVFKIYERVFAILNRINKSFVLRLGTSGFCVIKNMGKKGSIQEFFLFLRETDFLFLVKLIAGAVAAILALSTLMKYLLINHFTMTYSLFFGLIFMSIIIPVKMLNSLKGTVIFWVLAGIISTVSVSWSVNPYDKVKIKSDNLETQYQLLYQDGVPKASSLENNRTGRDREPGLFAFTGKYTIEEYVYAAICGAIAVSAMVLPGISGSLVMILMGAYFDVISAISALRLGHLDTLAFLGCFGAGIVVGGLFFARLINFVLKRYYNSTMAFLIGLMIGSLHALWPFKKVMTMAQQYVKQDGGIMIIENSQVYTNINILPLSSNQFLLSFAFFLGGCTVMYAFIRAESSQTPS